MSEFYLIYLICDAGITSSVMVNKMNNYIKSADLPIEVEAHPISYLDREGIYNKPDVIILGPQVRYLKQGINDQFDDILIMDIDNDIYANLDAEAAVTKIINLLHQ